MKNMDNITEMRNEGFERQKLIRVPRRVLDRACSQPFTRDFVVTDLGHFPPTGEHCVRREKGIAQSILIVVVSGCGWVESGGRKSPVKTGQVILLPAGTAHSYGSSEGDQWSIYWFHFEGRGADDLLGWLTREPGGSVLSPVRIDAVRRRFRSILAEVERGYQDHTLLELSRSLIDVLTLFHRPPPNRGGEKTTSRIESVMDEMGKELNLHHPLEFYARNAGLSVAQFGHLFREHTGVPPMAYRNELRIQRACELLDNTRLPVKEIADGLGYSDPLYFSRVFRTCTGISPKYFRERMV